MSEFDYIIIGAGSAGCVVAERLSEDGGATVLVVEAGGSDQRFSIRMPLGYAKCFTDPTVNWNYQPEPDPGLAGRINHWPRGKVLGGSSSINALVWMRGHAGDFEDWRDAGNVGWGYADVLPAFRALEDNEAGADAWRSTGGPVHIADVSRKVHPLTQRFIEAGVELGLPHNRDFNGADQEGVGIFQQNVSHGRRVSAADAFLRPAMQRPNLSIMTDTTVARIVVENGEATGIEIVRSGTGEQRTVLRARREVIVCAGSIASPQLLQLSGIGAGAHLNSLGIPVVVDNANVGANLQDHQSLNYAWRSTVPTLNHLLGTWWGKGLIGARYLLTHTGPLSMSVNQAGGFLKTDPALARPNMQIYFQASSAVPPRPGGTAVRQIDPWHGFAMGISNCRPRSTGEIVITTPDAARPPRITVNALSNDDDVADMLDGVRFLRKMAATKALAPYAAEEMRPGPAVTSDDALVADIRQRSGTVFHPVSTCRMAPDQTSGVVSPELAVHGVSRLRVIDASVFPSIISGNTNAATMMIGWKGAQMIKRHWR